MFLFTNPLLSEIIQITQYSLVGWGEEYEKGKTHGLREENFNDNNDNGVKRDNRKQDRNSEAQYPVPVLIYMVIHLSVLPPLIFCIILSFCLPDMHADVSFLPKF